MAGLGRYPVILLFESFNKALFSFLKEDEQVLSYSRSKATFAHCLASQLHRSLRSVLGMSEDEASLTYFELPLSIRVDIMVDGCDILVHNRKGTKLLAVILSHDYLTKAQQEHLFKLKDEGVELVLGVSMLQQKEYVLIYSPKSESLEYYHFNKNDGTTRHLMQREVESEEDSRQLSLGIKAHKRKKPTPGQ